MNMSRIKTCSVQAARLRFTLALSVAWLVCAYTPAPFANASAAPEENYRILAWDDLVPEDWRRPVIARAYNADAPIDEKAVVQDLDGQLAALPGYMLPMAFDGKAVTEFLLVPFLPHRSFSSLSQNTPAACAHPHYDANQKVYVYALEPVVVENPFEPIWIVGALSLDPVMADSGPVAYSMASAVTTPYEF